MAKKQTSKPAAVTTAITVLPPANAELATIAQDFARAKQLYLAGRSSVVQGVAFLALFGFDLKRLKNLYGVKRGGDRKSDQIRTGAVLIPKWADLIKEHFDGLSEDRAGRYIQLAEGVKRRLPVLQEMEEQLLREPLFALPEEKQNEVIGAVKKITDGKTASEIIAESGIVKPAPKIHESHRNKGGNKTTPKETPEEAAQNHFLGVFKTLSALRLENETLFTERLHALPLDHLEQGTPIVSLQHLEDELEAWKEAVCAAITRVKKAKRSKSAKPEAPASEESGEEAPLSPFEQ